MPRVAELHYPAGLKQPSHSHDTLSVTLLLAGSIRERVGQSEVIGQPFDIVIKPVDVVHSNEFGPTGARTLQIVVPASELDQPDGATSLLTRWRWTHAADALPAMLSLLAQLRAFNDAPVEDLAWNALGLIGPAPITSGRAPDWLQRVREQLDDESMRLPVARLARDAGVHPVYLTRQFRRWYGTSIIEYAARRRVQRAVAVMPGNLTLSQVAQCAGFADQAHFCREFRRFTGRTPSAFRSLLTH